MMIGLGIGIIHHVLSFRLNLVYHSEKENRHHIDIDPKILSVYICTAFKAALLSLILISALFLVTGHCADEKFGKTWLQ
jgi:preprotein translocase subunit Sec61beta